ncbi:Catechol 2,3-dioxygenase [Actinopolyspora xinjiangensis]|uniref:Catechol 2,3-dioxygenase n=1 Tax=Actinopolyspora xinjiangensis TaxID=405564 RepID=A0A1H0WN93_9ACTN|nr:Catechol 2,3-dioxygenase [Actinopolyspora xinjiangensis]
MSIVTSGLHHVTAIAGDPRRNAEFYLRTLGLRMVKITVNFDDPGTYHLYYGDESGRPGTLMTFFPFHGAPPGKQGNGQATATAFSVPEHSIGWWHRRLNEAGVEIDGVGQRPGEDVLTFRDPDGLTLSLVARPQPDPREPWENGLVPPEHGIRGLHSVTLSVDSEDATVSMLTEMGLSLAEQQDNRFRFAAGEGGPGPTWMCWCVPARSAVS